MTNNMERVFLNGEMDKGIRDNGSMENSTVEDILFYLMVSKNRDFGRMDNV